VVSTVSEASVEVLINELDSSLDPFRALDIDESDMGMLVGPRYDDEEQVWKIEVNVRTMIEGYDADLDVEYSFEELVAGDVVDDIYPELIEQIKGRYGEMQLQYKDPRI